MAPYWGARILPMTVGAGAGLLFCLSIPRVSVAACAWICLVPVLAVAWRPGQALWAGLGLGLAAGCGRVYWLAETLHLYGNLDPYTAAFTTGLLVLYLSLYYVLFTWVCSRWRLSWPLFPYLAASLWVLLEWIQTWMLSGFPWEFLGYSQYLNRPLVQLASLTGVYGLSFLIVCVNAALAQALALRRRWLATLAPPALLLALALGWGYQRLDVLEAPVSSPLRIGVVQGSIPQGEKWQRFGRAATTEHYADLAQALIDSVKQAAAAQQADLVIFPETALPYAFNHAANAPYRRRIETLARQLQTPLLVGSLQVGPETLFNRAFLIDHEGINVDFADKVHLVPFGEYLPLKWLFAYLEGLTAESGTFTHGRAHKALALPRTEHRFGVFICYESVFPGITRQLTRLGAEFLVNTTNDAWFGLTWAPYQHFSMSVLRAVESGRDVVRAANTGISGHISASGQILHTTPLFAEDRFVVEVTPRTEQTPYTLWGDGFVLLCAAFLALCGGVAQRRRHRRIDAERAAAQADLDRFAAQPQPLPRPVLLLHGYRSSPRTWDLLRYHLDRCSTNAQTHVLTAELNIDGPVDALTAHVIEQLPPATGSLDLVGHSLGGIVALHLADRIPTARLCLLATPAKGSRLAAAARFLGWPHGRTLKDLSPASAAIKTLQNRWTALKDRIYCWSIAADSVASEPPVGTVHQYAVPLWTGPYQRHHLGLSDPRILRDLVALLQKRPQ